MMADSNIKTPKVVKLARGTWREDRDGPKDEPDPSSGKPLADTPMMRLNEREMDFYRDLKQRVIAGVAQHEDEHGLAILAKLLARIDANEGSNSDHAHALRLMDRFALTPSARAQFGIHAWKSRDKGAAQKGFERFT